MHVKSRLKSLSRHEVTLRAIGLRSEHIIRTRRTNVHVRTMESDREASRTFALPLVVSGNVDYELR